MKKIPSWLVAVSDCVLLLFLGLVYAWSVFKKPLAGEFGWSDGQLTWTFTICMSFFCIGSFLAAKLTKYVKHQVVVIASGILIFLAFLLAGRMTQLWQLYVTYGVMIGFAVGAVYNCVLATGNQWFSGKAGLITGLFLMCFGSGSLLFGPLSTYLMGSIGWRRTFVVLGILFLVVFLLGSVCVCSPPRKHAHKHGNPKVDNTKGEFTPVAMMKTGSFWIYFLWSILLSAVGLALVGQVFTIADSFGFTDMSCSLMVSMVSVCNGFGRLVFGSLYDNKGTKLTMGSICTASIAGCVLLSLAVWTKAGVVLVLAFLLMGLGYGGVTPTNSNYIRDFFGKENYSVNFSIINFNLLISVYLGQFLGSSLYMKFGNYQASAAAFLVCCILGLGQVFFIKRPTFVQVK